MIDGCARCDRMVGRLPGTGRDFLPDGWSWLDVPSTGHRLPCCPDCRTARDGAATEGAGGAVGADRRLVQYLERLERLSDERRGLGDDMRDILSEAKAQGYDPKIMRLIIKERAMAPHDRAEMHAILDAYRAAVGLG